MDKRHLRAAKRCDRWARWAISASGVGVILCVLTMLALIAWTTVPLFLGADAKRLATFATPGVTAANVVALGIDDYRETGFLLDRHGELTFLDVRQGTRLDGARVPRPDGRSGELADVEGAAGLEMGLTWPDGAATLARVVFTPDFTDAGRRLRHRLLTLAQVGPLADGRAVAGLLRLSDAVGVTQVVQLDDGRLLVRRLPEDETEGTPDAQHTFVVTLPGEEITAFAADAEGQTLYTGTAGGDLCRWDIAGGVARLAERTRAFADGRRITSLGLVLGQVSLAVGDATGEVTTWFPVGRYGAAGEKQLTLIHRLSRHATAVTNLLFTRHDKAVLSLAQDGGLHLDHMTSERQLLALRGSGGFRLVTLSLQGDTLFGLAGDGRMETWAVHNPHPEVSWRTLLGRVWYEGYNEPQYTWQSSSANDDFEPKLSFVPLVFGTIKGTLYAMLFAVPLALFGALYTSQLTTPEVRSVVKPVVEVMAAMPSVVIGFLVALWLAPRLEQAIVPVLLTAFTVPAALIAFLVLWGRMRHWRAAKRLEGRYEFVLCVPILIAGAVAAWALGGPVERLAFAGDFRQWLFREAGTRFDQRNSIIIAFGLGFAVIPILFTMAEDALSNVPQSLRAASLALGASRWQTVWHVVLPSASPGVFAAVIIGFGRAVGETMIVLMATGNTPVLSWGPFSGMRTLSANIAVEIPEAPAGGTLFRVLFLSAVLLFLLTSVLNTAAEIIRSRLRKRYGY